MYSTVRRSLARAGLSGLLLATLLLGAQGVVQAAVPVGETGTHGEFSVSDTATHPGARCRYEGAAGTWYLNSMRVPAPTIYGASSQLRSVGYRLLLQLHTAHGWRTTQRGTLISGVADEDTTATLTGSSIERDVNTSPNRARYRAALSLVWWDAQAQVEGRVLLAIQHHRRSFDGSVAPACRGRLPIG